jgi:AcrR family transcriptional regulator
MLDAMIALIDRGNVRPTADEVATEAGVGIRTVFRHFSDMETLYAALAERSDATGLAGFADKCPGGTLEDRIRDLVARRSEFLDQYGERLRASSILRGRSRVLDRQMRQLSTVTSRQNLAWLPELEGADRDVANAFEAALSWGHWDQLRREQGLDAEETRRAVELAALAVAARV